MEHYSSWFNQQVYHLGNEVVDTELFSNLNGDGNETLLLSMDVLLPDDILERILSYLPIASIFRAGSVCKRWYEIVKSRRFLWNLSSALSLKPWYFMFTQNDAAAGYAFDPVLRKWYGGIDLPCIEKSSWLISTSCGLISFMDNDIGSNIYVCNPITKRWRGLEELPGVKYSDYSSLSISTNRKSHSYSVAVTKSIQVQDDFLKWNFFIYIYESEIGSWIMHVKEIFTGWRGGDESVICNGILYCLIYSTGVVGNSELRHRLIMSDLSSRSSYASLLRNSVQVPCPITCGRLMNLKEKLVMVGGIGKQDRQDIIKGIGIWELDNNEWHEISRMPHRYFQGFGEFDDVFASSGTDDLIYIQSFGAPALLVFDLTQKQWKWSLKCPVSKRFPLQLFTGFCFEPRLEISP